MTDTAYLEKALIGSLLLRPDRADQAAPLDERDFACDPLCRALWPALRNYTWTKGPIDVAHAADLLAHQAPDLHHHLRTPAAVAELSVYAPSAGHIGTYARLLRDATTRRDIITLGYQLTEQAAADDPDRIERLRGDIQRIRFDADLNRAPLRVSTLDVRARRQPGPAPAGTGDRMRHERAVLGAAIHDNPPGSRRVVQESIKPDMFTSPALRQAWLAVQALCRRGLPVDEITVHWRLQHAGTRPNLGLESLRTLRTDAMSFQVALDHLRTERQRQQITQLRQLITRAERGQNVPTLTLLEALTAYAGDSDRPAGIKTIATDTGPRRDGAMRQTPTHQATVL